MAENHYQTCVLAVARPPGTIIAARFNALTVETVSIARRRSMPMPPTALDNFFVARQPSADVSFARPKTLGQPAWRPTALDSGRLCT